MIQASKIQRKDLFITSKISPKEQGFTNGYNAILDSLDRLQLDYIDCMLIHWPGAQGLSPLDPKNKELRIQTYKALEKAFSEGLVKCIGVSNYLAKHLTEMKDYVTVKPMVLQMELHPLYCPEWVFELQKSMDLVVTSYSTLGEGRFLDGSVKLNSVSQISSNKKIKESRILLKWAIQKGFTVIPKTSKVERLDENKDLFGFELDHSEMDSIGNEIKLHGEQKYCWEASQIA